MVTKKTVAERTVVQTSKVLRDTRQEPFYKCAFCDYVGPMKKASWWYYDWLCDYPAAHRLRKCPKCRCVVRT